MKKKLFLYEEILLLALRDEEGTPHTSVFFDQAIAGALVAELLLAGRIKVDDKTKNRLVSAVSRDPLGDELLDECLEQIYTAKRRAPLSNWVWKFSGMRKLKDRAALGLCRKGVLKADEDKVLLFFTRKIYPEADPTPEREIRKRLHEAIFGKEDIKDARTAVLISLANASDLLRTCFDKKELKARKKRIVSIVSGELTGAATQEAVQATQAALLLTTVIVPTVITVTS